MRKTWVFTLGAAVAIFSGVPAGYSQSTGAISGTVTVAGARDAADVVVYVDVAGTPPEKHALMDQRNQTFVPHVLPIIKGTTVDFPNNDKVQHNVYSPAGSARPFNLGTYPAGMTKVMRFDKPGVVPLFCNVHTEMSAYILVLETPHFAVTDRAGTFTISGVPAGKYTLKTWYEGTQSTTREVVVDAGKTAKLNFEVSAPKKR